MAVESTGRLALGAELPEFSLPDHTGKIYHSSDFTPAPGVLVMFICNHCPYVTFISEHLAKATAEFADRGIAVVGINPNAATHPEDSVEKMAEEIQRVGYSFPYLVDEDQEVTRRYRAECTPDLFLFDENAKLAYRGQFDDARPRRVVEVTGKDLRAAVDAVLSKQPVPEPQKPSMGCSIKWLEGAEPSYSS